MIVSWTNENNKRITAVYWSDGLTLKDIEKYSQDCDYIQVWYPRNLSDDIYEEYQELFSYIEMEAKWKGEAFSLQTNLLQSEENILQSFSKSNRYKVRRARQRDNLSLEFVDNPDMSELIKFEAYYNKFANQTGELQNLDIRKVQALCDSKQFVLAKIRDADGEILAVHGYIIGEKEQIAALFSSSSYFRENEEKKALIGRANCLLHYASMLYFKGRGFGTYDFGGMYLGDENLHYKRISEFKRRLGGEVAEFQNGFIIPISEARRIEHNLCECISEIGSANIVLWGYSNFGKYTERLLAEVCFRKCKYIIDNKLYKENPKCVSEQILNKLAPNQVYILVCTDTANYDRIVRQDNVLEFAKGKRIIHMRG